MTAIVITEIATKTVKQKKAITWFNPFWSGSYINLFLNIL